MTTTGCRQVWSRETGRAVPPVLNTPPRRTRTAGAVPPVLNTSPRRTRSAGAVGDDSVSLMALAEEQKAAG
ncbi:unnamed protein product [Arctogadus glacialis]